MKNILTGDNRTGGSSQLIAPHAGVFMMLGCLPVWLISCQPALSAAFSARSALWCAAAACLFLSALLYETVVRKRRDTATLLSYVLIGSFVLKALYVLTTPYNASPHDLFSFAGFDSPEYGEGHLGYIEYLCKYRQLPDFDPRGIIEFTHPPAFHILSALMLSVTMDLGAGERLAYESLQILPLLFANLAVLAMLRTMEELGIKGKALLLLSVFLGVYPFYMIFAGAANNDIMSACLMSYALLYTVRWWKEPVLKRILPIALSLGFAMGAKLTAATLSFPIGGVFLWNLWRDRRQWKEYFLQFTAFLGVCAPLGLYYPVRNWIKFGVPMNYVFPQPRDGYQYISDPSLWSRLGLPTREQLSYAFREFDAGITKNVFIETMRTALFDEIQPYTTGIFLKVALVMLWLSIFLCLWMNIALVWSMCKKGTLPPAMKFFLLMGYGVMLLLYIKFTLDEPFICAMNYRYIPLGILYPCIGSGLWLQGGAADPPEKRRLGRAARGGLCGSMACFILLAAAVDAYLVLFPNVKYFFG